MQNSLKTNQQSTSSFSLGTELGKLDGELKQTGLLKTKEEESFIFLSWLLLFRFFMQSLLTLKLYLRPTLYIL